MVKLLLTSLIFASLLVLVPMNAEAKTYTVPDKFTFDYPTGWKVEKKENRFTDREATLEAKDGSAITFEHSTDLDESYTDDQSIVDELESVAQTKYDASIYESGADKYMVNNQTAPYVLATFEKSNLFGYSHNYVVMAVWIKLKDSTVLMQYLAEENDFDKHLGQVEKIFQSVEGLGNGTAVTETETDNSSTSRGDDLPKTRALCDTVTTQSAKDLCETLLN